MQKKRFDRLLAATAMAVVLATAAAVRAGPDSAIEAAIPVPESADLKPLTPADIGEPSQSLKSAEPAAEPAASATPAVEPAKSAGVAEPVDPLAAKLKDLLAARGERIFGNRKERAPVEAFYAARSYAPIWVTNGVANERATAAIAYLGTVDREGLDPDDYPTPYFKANGEPDALAEAELKLTASVLTFARHAQAGRVHFSRIGADISYNLDVPAPGDVLAKLAEAPNTADALAAFNPPHPQYQALKAKLAELRRGEGDAPRIAHGSVLKLGRSEVHDSRVPRLRERLGLAGAAGDTTYDRALADAVAAFQKQHGLASNGHLNSATVEALNGPRRERDADIVIANMERWRWMPRDLGRAHVILNVPEFTLRVYRDGAVIWQTRVVVGKPSTATPMLSETMKYITVNPTWNVPPSIVYNEYLPALQQDPTVLSRMGLHLSQNADGSVHISQPPGERNALGRLRFNFPNRFLVYQHDTPEKHLFAPDKRAFSHGCMRVQDPLKYAELMLSLGAPKEAYTQQRIRSMFGSSEVDIRFSNPIPVHVTYQTAFVDDAGKLQIREDIYGRDARTIAALKGDERRVADIPVERAQPSYGRPRMPPGLLGDSFASGPSFFDLLFGRPVPPARVPQRRYYMR